MSMGDEELRHLAAAQRHDEAASLHEESAVFWDEQGDPERADQQRELARQATRLGKRARNNAASARDADPFSEHDGGPPNEAGNGEVKT